MRLLFWGTSAFAAPSLRALVGEDFDVVGVVTRPDRPVGRSRSTLTPPVIKVIAAGEGFPVLQPERLREDDGFVDALRALEPELSVVVAYGQILPRSLIDLPPRGTINVHASLLPRLRGAAPIQAAICDGFTETGVTIMRMVPALDAGPILLQARTPIAADETAGELELRLSELGALALVEAVTLLALGEVTERPQDERAATYAGKIDRAMTQIDWRADAGAIGRAIRAYDPVPGAATTQRGVPVKLFGAVEEDDHAFDESGGVPAPGEVLQIDDRGLLAACGAGQVRVRAVQPAGRRRVDAVEWARGRGVTVGDRLGG